MTAVPGTHGSAIDVICDDCDAVACGSSTYLHDEDLVWPVLAEIGWQGSPFAAGRHRCPRCSDLRSGGHPAVPSGDARPEAVAGLTIQLAANATVVVAHGELNLRNVDELRRTLTASGSRPLPRRPARSDTVGSSSEGDVMQPSSVRAATVTCHGNHRTRH